MSDRRDRLAIALFVALFAMVLVRTAWIADDALIELRTVENFISGHGLRWNPNERVEVFADPLWVLLLSGLGWSGLELYFTALALSGAAVLIAVSLLAGVGAADTIGAVVAILVLTFSRAFVDYATSGLGTPLAYLLIVAFLIAYSRPPGLPPIAYRPPRLRAMAVTLGLLLLTAPMAALLLIPAFTRAVRGSGRAATAGVVVAAAPIAAWLGFAYLYYGSPLPNGLYAWWNQSHPVAQAIAAGARYLADSLKNDPLTLAAIGVSLASWRFGPGREAAAILLGLAVYLVAVVLAGADTASGRLLAAPVLVSAFVIARLRWEDAGGRAAGLAVATVLTLGCIRSYPTILSGSDYGVVAAQTVCWSVCDERRRVYQRTGLLKAVRGHPALHEGSIEREIGRLTADGEHVVVTADIGLIGYMAGARLHIVDPLGRTDPLLARLPSTEAWRPGYLSRRIPDGYVDVLSQRASDLPEPGLARLERQIAILTRAPIFSAERLRVLVGLERF